jgi:endonuclease/exonuclease/phosphatase family metal-dependent hydrolase
MANQAKSGKKGLGLFNSIILVLNLLSLSALALSYLSVHISPEKNSMLPFIGIMYPVILLINIFFMIYWIFRKRWIFVIPAIVILAGWSHINRTFQFRFHGKDLITGKAFKITTYNVKNLSNDNVDLVEPSVRNKIIGFLDSDNSDILCLQEFAVIHPNPDAFIDSLSVLFDMPYHAHSLYLTRPRRLMDAMFIFSKFPIILYGPISKDNTHNFGIQADMLIGKDTVRVMNVHLESVRLKHEDYSFISDLDLQFREDENLQASSLRIFKKLRNAYHNRAIQVDSLNSFIRNSPYPVILCGDFNDTPNSYTYQELTSNLKDSFIESGSGFGNTYIGNLPSFRIDYILYDEYFTSVDYSRAHVKFSDHYPISCLVEPRKSIN